METFEKQPDFEQKMELERARRDVLELRKPTEKILEQISPLLESGEIQLIIGDDASGRIPTAIFRKIFDMAYKERGFVTPETRFLSGSRHLQGEAKIEKKKKIAEYLEGIKGDIKKKFGRPLDKALIVTDMIGTGHSLDPLVEVLSEMGVSTEVASIGTTKNEKEMNETGNQWRVPLYLGMDYVPDIYEKQKLSGVIKEEEELFAETYKNKWRMSGTEKGEKVQDQINKAREISDTIAVDVYEKWKTAQQDDKK